MSLSRTTAIVTLALLFAAFLICGVLYLSVVPRSFQDMETSHMTAHINSVQNAFRDRIRQLDNVAADYASWDLTYQFMQTRDSGYERSELTDDSLQSLNVYLFLLLDTKGKIALLKVVGERPRTITSDQLQSIAALASQVARNNLEGGITGVIASGSDPLLVSLRPILDSRNQGPSRGTLVLARRIDDKMLGEISSLTQAPLRIAALTRTSSVPVNELNGSNGSSYSMTFERERTHALILLRDLNSQPAAALELAMPRDTWLRAAASQKMGIALMLGTAFVFTLINLLFIRYRVVSRIEMLSRLVADVQSTGDLKRRAIVRGADDIAHLTCSMNEMLSKLQVTQEALIEARAKLQLEASHDPLTGAFNRRAGMETLERELARSRREQRSLSLFVLDLDNFKAINDSFGHAAGDMVLSETKGVLSSCLRPFDTLIRTGGDEFLIVTPGASIHVAVFMGERILKRLRATAMEWNGTPMKVTATMGVACSCGELSKDELIALADRALYRGKAKGRDCIECEDFSTAGVIRSLQVKGNGLAQRPL
jgi:diguanylate cyclase (GGDEF)-like protein